MSLIRRSDFYLLPNVLTLSRVAAIPLVATAAYLHWDWTAVIIFSSAGISDYTDGYIARKYHYESKLGMLLDPLADKLIVLSTMVMLLWLGRLKIEIDSPGWAVELIPPLLVVVTVGREIAITGLRSIASTAGMVLPADRGGKIKTWVQFAAIILLLLNQPKLLTVGHVLLGVSVVAALWSGIRYVMKFLRTLPD